MTPIEQLVDTEDWEGARRAIREQLRRDPEDHWLLTRLSLTYYEQKRYRMALRYAKQAATLKPECPLVLWDLAGALQMLGAHRAAIRIYQQLVDRGVRRIANDACGEGKAWSRGLIADCHLRMSDSWKDLGDRTASMSEFEKHLDLRGPGCHSIYKVGELDPLRMSHVRRAKGAAARRRRARPPSV